MTSLMTPSLTPKAVIVYLWLAWIISWVAAAAWTNKTEKRLRTNSELPIRLIVGVIVLIVGAQLLSRHAQGGHLGHLGRLKLWPVTPAAAWACVALVACGFAFTWWARVHLGALWSASITKKENHRVIDTGPYRIVRHPIYTGLLLAAYASGAATGAAVGIVWAVIITVGVWIKARLEERWLSRELEAGAYEDYRRRVPMLVPFGPRPHRAVPAKSSGSDQLQGPR